LDKLDLSSIATQVVTRVMGDASLVTMTQKLDAAYDAISKAMQEHGEPVALADIHTAVDQALTDYYQAHQASQAP
jgi:hypothetical protein